MLHRFIVSVLCLLSVAAASAQGTIIEDLTVRQLGEGVVLRWRIGQGNSCVDMNIQRSNDSLNFDKLGEFRGLCGSNDSDTWYEWFDDTGLDVNSKYWYRIWASNGTVVSRPVFVEFRDSNAGALSIAPNPMQQSAVIYYANPLGDPVSLHLFDLKGAELYRTQEAPVNQFNLDNTFGRSGNLQPGIYLLQIQSEGKTMAVEKLLVH